MAKLCYVVFALVNTLVALIHTDVPRFQRILRPVMLVAHFRNVQKIFGNMMTTAPKVARVSFLLVFHLILHAVFAFLVFSGQSFDGCDVPRDGKYCSPFTRNCTDYFGTFFGSINQLFILLTTANFPVQLLSLLWLPLPLR